MRDHQRHQTRRVFLSVSVLGRAGFLIASVADRAAVLQAELPRAGVAPRARGPRAPGRPALTTPLSFPGEAANQQDGIFDVVLAR
jgi:hypothetical protein